MRSKGAIAKLDEALARSGNKGEIAERLAELRSKVAYYERHGILVTEDCGRCGGDGKWIDPRNSAIGYTCPVCDGSGKVLKDGAKRWVHAERDDTVEFPASWLEGASDE